MINFDGERAVQRTVLSFKMGELFHWLEWAKRIPFIDWPPHWQVKAVPPYFGALIRYYVRTKEMNEDDAVSIYLDCFDQLGTIGMGEPYWEVYPVAGSNARCRLEETDELLRLIAEAIREKSVKVAAK